MANFIVARALGLARAVGLRRALRPRGGAPGGVLLVGAWPVGLLGAGIFATDPLSGYPPGTPDQLAHHGSAHAALHDGFSLVAFLAMAVARCVFARHFAGWGERAWARYSARNGVVFVAAFVLSQLGFGQAEGLVDLAGLFQRVAIAAGWCWLSLLALHLLRRRELPLALSRRAPRGAGAT